MEYKFSIGTRVYTTNNQQVLINLEAFANELIKNGIVKLDEQVVSKVSTAGIIPEKQRAAKDIVVKFELSPVTVSNRKYFIVKKEIDSKQFPKGEYKGYRYTVNMLASKWIKSNFQTVTIDQAYTQKDGSTKIYPMIAINANEKSFPTETIIKGEDIKKSLDEYDANKQK